MAKIKSNLLGKQLMWFNWATGAAETASSSPSHSRPNPLIWIRRLWLPRKCHWNVPRPNRVTSLALEGAAGEAETLLQRPCLDEGALHLAWLVKDSVLSPGYDFNSFVSQISGLAEGNWVCSKVCVKVWEINLILIPQLVMKRCPSS